MEKQKKKLKGSLEVHKGMRPSCQSTCLLSSFTMTRHDLWTLGRAGHLGLLINNNNKIVYFFNNKVVHKFETNQTNEGIKEYYKGLN